MYIELGKFFFIVNVYLVVRGRRLVGGGSVVVRAVGRGRGRGRGGGRWPLVTPRILRRGRRGRGGRGRGGTARARQRVVQAYHR